MRKLLSEGLLFSLFHASTENEIRLIEDVLFRFSKVLLTGRPYTDAGLPCPLPSYNLKPFAVRGAVSEPLSTGSDFRLCLRNASNYFGSPPKSCYRDPRKWRTVLGKCHRGLFHALCRGSVSASMKKIVLSSQERSRNLIRFGEIFSTLNLKIRGPV